jgi:hypothetical protein
MDVGSIMSHHDGNDIVVRIIGATRFGLHGLALAYALLANCGGFFATGRQAV